MYIDIVPNRNSAPAVLLREGWREGGRIRKRTLANLSKLPPQAIEALRRVLGGETLVIAESSTSEQYATFQIALETGLGEMARGTLCLPPMQILAYARARARGLDPDRPRHLQQAVVLKTP